MIPDEIAPNNMYSGHRHTQPGMEDPYADIDAGSVPKGTGQHRTPELESPYADSTTQ